jgi:hypothetical protein
VIIRDPWLISGKDEALLGVCQVQALKRPSKEQLRHFKLFLHLAVQNNPQNPEDGTRDFQEAEFYTWGDENDLITVHQRDEEEARLEPLLAKWMIPVYDALIGCKEKVRGQNQILAL